MDKVKVLMVMTDFTSVGHFRIGWPGEYLRSIDCGIEVTVKAAPDVNPFDIFNIRHYDIVHFNRLYGTIESIEAIHKLYQEHNVKLVMDLDDHWEVPVDTYLRKQREKLGAQGFEKLFLKHADHVTTTTRLFKKELEAVNPNVTVIPNGVDPTHRMWQYEEYEAPICRIGWLGSIQRGQDLVKMKDSIQRLYEDKEVKGQFSFTQVGGEEADTHVFQGPGFRWYQGVDAFEYGHFYQKVDVCLAPLKHNMYNHCKSELKMVEAGLKKKAFIGQKYGIYQDHIVNGHNGFLVDNDDEWYDRIKQLILDKPLRKRLGEQLHKEMMVRFSLPMVAQQRIDFYKKLKYGT